uniref:Uncharacterized protein n=1 Tax=Oryza glumipatula TaxID=40148 RepID=A0A0D9YP82_9ORYZ
MGLDIWKMEVELILMVNPL